MSPIPHGGPVTSASPSHTHVVYGAQGIIEVRPTGKVCGLKPRGHGLNLCPAVVTAVLYGTTSRCRSALMVPGEFALGGRAQMFEEIRARKPRGEPVRPGPVRDVVVAQVRDPRAELRVTRTRSEEASRVGAARIAEAHERAHGGTAAWPLDAPVMGKFHQSAGAGRNVVRFQLRGVTGEGLRSSAP